MEFDAFAEPMGPTAHTPTKLVTQAKVYQDFKHICMDRQLALADHPV